MKLRTVASAISLIDGAWLIYAGWFWSRTFFFPVPTPVTSVSSLPFSNWLLLGLGVVLLLDSLVSLLNWSVAFYVSAVLAVLAVLEVVVAGPSPAGAQFEAGAVLLSVLLGALTIALDVLAARRKSFVPEEDHPLNLPVFG